MSRVPLAVIASLTVSDLFNSPYYCQLRENYDHLCGALVRYAERDLSLRRATESSTLVTGNYHVIAPCGVNSPAPSLGPSDSASQQTKLGFSLTEAIDELLERVEPPITRPSFLPKSVLWDYQDCKDQTEDVVVADLNKRRLKMSLAIRRGDGTKISGLEFTRIRRAANVIGTRLVNLINSDPRLDVLVGNSWTKSNIKKVFHAEFRQAILELEAEQKILRLCSAHWKANAVIDQEVSWPSDAETKALTDDARPTSMSSPPDMEEPSESPAAFIPQVSDVAPINTTKRAFELSPGPKSPSVSRAQKRSKDDAGGTSSRVPVVPTTRPSYRDVAMSSAFPLAPPLKHTFTPSMPITDNLAVTQASEAAPTGRHAATHQQRAAGTEPTPGPSAGLGKDARADAIWLRLLRVSELQALFRDVKYHVKKSMRKDNLIAIMIFSPRFAHVSRSTVQGIVEERKMKKRLAKQRGALQ